MKRVEARAKADADAALGPGPFKRPPFGCGDVRPRNRGEAGSFDTLVLEVAQNYESYGRIDPHFGWAPVYCRLPSAPRPSFSTSPDAETHGQKLYLLFAKEPWAYTEPGGSSPVGQVVVKEAWVPEEVTDDEAKLEPVRRTIRERVDRFYPYAKK